MRSSSTMSLPILPSSQGRQRSTTRRAEGGGGSRVRASRVNKRTASAIVPSVRSVIPRNVEAVARLKVSVGEKACVIFAYSAVCSLPCPLHHVSHGPPPPLRGGGTGR